MFCLTKTVLHTLWSWDLGGPWGPLDLYNLGTWRPGDPVGMWTIGAHVDLTYCNVLEEHGQVTDPHNGLGVPICAECCGKRLRIVDGEAGTCDL